MALDKHGMASCELGETMKVLEVVCENAPLVEVLLLRNRAVIYPAMENSVSLNLIPITL